MNLVPGYYLEHSTCAHHNNYPSITHGIILHPTSLPMLTFQQGLTYRQIIDFDFLFKNHCVERWSSQFINMEFPRYFPGASKVVENSSKSDSEIAIKMADDKLLHSKDCQQKKTP